MASKRELSVVIPFYNEEKAAEKTVKDLAKVLASGKIDFEFVLVNNGSKDNTKQILSRLKKRGKFPVTLVNVEKNIGYGYGMQKGIEATNAKYVCLTHADGQVSPDVLPILFHKINNVGYDLVKVKRIKRRDGISRKVASAGYNMIYNTIFRTGTWDINASPKMISGNVLKKMALASNDWAIDAEIMIKLKRLNRKYKEYPVVFDTRQTGISKVKQLATVREFLKNIPKLQERVRSWEVEL